MNIAVYAISKNESKFADAWVDSMSEADSIYVLDTGSEDDTVERFRTRGVTVGTAQIRPWRFDTARNLALEMVPADVDICVSTDIDEVFRPGWRAALEQAWTPGVQQANFRYTWNFNPDGSEGFVFWREKIHARHGFTWVNPVHEVLSYLGPGRPKVIFVQGVQLDHHADVSKSRAQYLPLLELSQNYNFFYDQLEKANLFLQGIIDRVDLPLDDRMVDWLFMNPVSDGGQFTGLADNVSKYGVVPREAMPETYSSENTSRLRQLLSTKLRRDGMELRRMAAGGAKAKALEARKQQMLADVYRMLALTLGEPPAEFVWKRKDSKGNTVDSRKYTPQEFYAEYFGNDLKGNYVMLMNDPSRPYYKVYEIDYDRHTYDGDNWRYINLPVEEIKAAAIASIKDSTAMYFSCDVGKQMDRTNGTLDLDNYDYEALMGVSLDMDKRDRILSHASASTHAMTLVGVDIDANGKPTSWLIENSWGPGANDGHLLATDNWMDEYMFRLVVERKYLPEATLKLLDQKPQMLPAWDFMFTNEE